MGRITTTAVLPRVLFLALAFSWLPGGCHSSGNEAPVSSPVNQSDCVAGPISLGAGATCKVAGDFFTTTQLQTNLMTFAATSGWSVFVGAYTCTTYNCKSAPDWRASHSFTTSGTTVNCTSASTYCVSPSQNNPCRYTFYATTGGTSGRTEPTWSILPCQTSPNSVTDGTVTWAPVLLKVIDQNSNVLSCFSWSPSSPFVLQVAFTGNSYLNWAMYCPSLPENLTQIGLKCFLGNTAASCWLSMMASAYTGMCTTGSSCIDVDGCGNVATTTSMSTSTSTQENGGCSSATSTTSYTNEMLFALGGTVNDEALSNSGGCSFIDSGNTQGNRGSNTISYKLLSSPTVGSCGYTWSPADTAGMFVVAIRTGESGSNPSGAVAKVRSRAKIR